jgi:hypothetical protein
MVGYVVPVWRPTLQKWGIGEATDFDEHTAMHHVTFLDETEDSAIVSQSPYDDYLAFYRERARKRRASNEDDDIMHHSLSPSERVSEDANAESPDKENDEMMQVRNCSHLLLCRPQMLILVFATCRCFSRRFQSTVTNTMPMIRTGLYDV